MAPLIEIREALKRPFSYGRFTYKLTDSSEKTRARLWAAYSCQCNFRTDEKQIDEKPF